MENTTLFKTHVGSYVYGTFIEGVSDLDYKGVYAQPIDDLIGFKKYKEQINVTDDETYFEIGRFMTLLETANPTVLELLYMPEKFIITKHPAFDFLIEKRDMFLTKKVIYSFGGYAVAQIRKARGLDKKINWENDRITRKTPIDFCYVSDNGKSVGLLSWLEKNNYNINNCGLVNLDHMKDVYSLYYSETHKFNGVANENGNDIKLSSIPKGLEPKATLYFNKDGYSSHCKDYLEYTEWLKKRNVNRFVNTQTSNKIIDGKNMLHCRRLLDMLIEIVNEKTINIERPNADYLLSIRNGSVDMNELLDKAEQDIEFLNSSFKTIDLPDSVSSDEIHKLLLKIRKNI